MKKIKQLDFKCFFVLCIVAAIIYIVTRYFMKSLYTPEWAARHIFIYVFVFLEVMALLGYRKFVSAVVAGYVIGLAAGEILGGFESHIGPQYNHWGWLILIAVTAVSCIIGFFIEEKGKNR